VLGAAGAAVAVVLAAALIGRAMGGSGASPSASPFPSTSQIAVQSDVPSESPSNGPPPSGSQPPPKPLKIAIVVKDNAANSKGIIASVRQAIADAGGSVRSLKVSAPSSAILFEATPGFDLTPILDDPDIVAVVGPYTSPVAATHIPETSEQGLAMCSPSATQDSLTVQNLRAGRPVSFVRTVMTNGHQGAATARFVFDDLGLRRVFIVGKGSGTGRASQFEEYWKSNNGDVVDNQSMDAKAVDYTGLALSIKATAPDVVYFSGNGGDDTSAGAFYKQLRSSGVGVPFVTSGEAFTDKFQRDVSGFADSQLYTTYPTAAYYANRPGFTDKLGIDPGIYALTAYSCARAILDGMARTDLSLDRGSLRDEIRATVVDPNLTHHSPMGDFSFDPNGDTRLQILTAYQFDTDSSAWIAIGETAAP
jgi:branched-chain amino acid transport system substrate-binding protein